jgi:protein-tyrosine-phosphatase
VPQPDGGGWARKRIAERLEVEPEPAREFGFVRRVDGRPGEHGSPAARLAIQVLKELGVDLGDTARAPALSRDLASFDRIYCMTRGHASAGSRAAAGRTAHVELLDPDGADVPDPIGGTREDYTEALRRIQAAIERRLPEWA